MNKLWSELGGSKEALARLSPLAEAAAEETFWQPVGKSLPAFRLLDQQRKPWDNKALAGKAVFAVIWASWCAPCKSELPRVAELAPLAAKKGIQVIGLNVDDDPTAALAYLDDHPLPFANLIGAAELVGAVTSARSIPRSWLIDSQTVVAHELVGYSDIPAWPEHTLAELEKLLNTISPD
jgi:thiol-disulfide isomerase/thioredoxin